jgi:cytochrome c biogenesis protein CcdA
MVLSMTILPPGRAAKKALLLLPLLLIFTAAGFAGEIRLEYYGEIGCSHCDLFQEKVLPEAEKAAGIEASAEYHDILSESGFELCEQQLAEMGVTFSIFPVLIIGNNAYQGNSAVESGLLEELRYYAEHGQYMPPLERVSAAGAGLSLAFLPVFLAGLVDGVNPCAFATMLFFISWIALRGGSRKRMLLAGSGFIAGIFFAYLLIGFGLFSFFRAAGDMLVIRQLMRWLFFLLALAFALLSLRDALVFRKTGKPASIILQLPPGLKKRIHSIIRHSEGSGTRHGLFLFPALLLTGIAVAFLELACTGQIYFPAIAYMVQSGEGHRPLFWLLLYNGAFILPLLLLFVLAIAGVSQQRIGGWFRRNLAAGKFAASLLFLLLAAVIWFSG